MWMFQAKKKEKITHKVYFDVEINGKEAGNHLSFDDASWCSVALTTCAAFMLKRLHLLWVFFLVQVVLSWVYLARQSLKLQVPFNLLVPLFLVYKHLSSE